MFPGLPENVLEQGLEQNRASQAEETLTCRRCDTNYQQTVCFDFYSLCNECFQRFDRQKMRGRLSTLGGRAPRPYFEDSRAWILADRECGGAEEAVDENDPVEKARSALSRLASGAHGQGPADPKQQVRDTLARLIRGQS